MAIDEATRVRLSARQGMAEAEVETLAGDPSVTVRATLAMNPTLTPDANAMLAHDPDERVRALLARKLAGLTLSLSDGAMSRLRKETFDTLTALAQDEAERVRAAIAEVVKDLPTAPRDIILRLARDQAVTVCEPIVRFSPLLTTDDLLALVTASAAVRLAVARREAIDVDVSDALICHGDEEVILALLMNESAQIREATLDALAERSAASPAWHGPLVNRPALSETAVHTLSRIVADHWLETLAARGDLPPSLTAELRTRVSERLNKVSVPDHPADAAGKPDETTLLDVVRDGDARKAAVLLSNAADVPLSVVQRAATLRSAKGLVSLAWKAGFSMKSGYALQILLGRLSPGVALKSGPGNSFPLSVQEMRWQIDFLAGNLGQSANG